MLINYLTITLRSFRKNYLYATLNILGLAIGFRGLHPHRGISCTTKPATRTFTPGQNVFTGLRTATSQTANSGYTGRVYPVDYINELPS